MSHRKPKYQEILINREFYIQKNLNKAQNLVKPSFKEFYDWKLFRVNMTNSLN